MKNQQLLKIVSHIINILGDDIKNIDFEKAIAEASKCIYSPVENNLVEINSPLLAEWNEELNNGIKPEYYTRGSKKEIKWKCNKCGYIWKVSIKSRTTFSTGCPQCGFCIFDRKYHKKNRRSVNNKMYIFRELI